MSSDEMGRVEQVVELFQNQRNRSFKVCDRPTTILMLRRPICGFTNLRVLVRLLCGLQIGLRMAVVFCPASALSVDLLILVSVCE